MTQTLNRRQFIREQWAANGRRLREGWAIYRQNGVAMAGLILLILFALIPPCYSLLRRTVWEAQQYDPINGFEDQSMPNPAPPSWLPVEWLPEDDLHRFDLNRPSHDHLLGTDTLGRDVLSVAMASTRNSYIVGIAAALTTAVVAIFIAAVSAYYRGWIDGLFTYITDAFMLLPAPIFMVIYGVFFQLDRTTLLETIYVALGGVEFSDALFAFMKPFEFGLIYGIIAGAGGVAIILRAHALMIMSQTFIEASRVAGARGRTIIWRHLVPHLLPLAAVYMMVIVTGAVVADGFVAFFGFNPDPLSWGTMIYNGFVYRVVNFVIPWYAITTPAVFISLFAASFYMVSRGLQQVVDPLQRSISINLPQ